MKHLLSRVPLRIVIILPFVAQLSLAVGLTAWLSIRNGQKAVNQVTRQLRQETTARISNEIADLLSTTRVINQLSAKTIQREDLDLSQIRSVEPAYWDYINTFQTIRGLGAGNTAGDILAMFQRVENGDTRYFLEYSNQQTQQQYVSQQLDDQRRVVQSTAFDRYIDARERPWYIAAVQAGGPVWTDIYPSVSEVSGHSLAINSSQPIYAEDGQLQGVVSVILDLGQVSQLIDAIEFSPSGQIYIIEADGNLIGSSDGSNPVLDNGQAIARLPASQSEARLIRESAAYLQDFLGNDFQSVNQAMQLDFDLEGERQLLQITPIRADSQLEWFIVVVAPEADFMEQIYANTRLTWLLCLAAFGLATLSGLLTSRWITRPLLQLNQKTKEIATDQLANSKDHQGVTSRGTREVKELADSFNRMVSRLQTSFRQMQVLNRHLAESESRLQQLLEALPVGTAVHEPSGKLIYLNRVGRNLLGVTQTPETPADQLTIAFQMYQAETQAPYPQPEIPAIRALAGETVYAENMELRQADQVVPIEIWASPIYGDDGRVAYAVAAFQDISDRQRIAAQMVYNALHDSLTDLPNRALLVQRLELAISRTQQVESDRFAVLFLDLDRFKVVNDSLGHLIGDQLLIAAARKLQQVIQPADLAARLGGDEFVVLLESVENIQSAIRLAEAIFAEFQIPVTLEGREVTISTSIGIVLGSPEYSDASDLLRDADIALYRAKSRGQGRYEVFDVEMHIQVLKRMQLESDLRQAIAHSALSVHYQPIFSLERKQPIGFEALVRWVHPTQGVIPPPDFIAVAEETGLITALDYWVLETACSQLAAWHQQFPQQRHLKVSVNLSSRDLQEIHLVDTVTAILKRTGLEPSCLTLEITENILIGDTDRTIAALHALRNQGICISIDDFGTGYSSLSYLYNLPADSLKVDKSFVGSMRKNGKNFKIVEAVITLSNQLQIDAIAEGIETQQQLDWLREMGCELGQGYLVSRPLTSEAVTQLMAEDRFIS